MKLNKILIGAGIAASAALSYTLLSTSSSIDKSLLANIPADTVMLSAQFKPFPLKAYITSDGKRLQSEHVEPVALDALPSIPFSSLFISLYNSTWTKLDKPEQLLAQLGLADSIRSTFYFIGLLPVLKFEVAEPSAFWAELDRAEAVSGLHHQQKVIQGESVRYYLDASHNEELGLVIAEKEGWVTITLHHSTLGEHYTAQALGVAPVSNPISEGGYIDDIFNKYSFIKDGVSFVNHQAFIKGVTTESGNTLAKQLSAINISTSTRKLSILRSAECHDELTSVANNWPQTVVGWDKIDVEDGLLTTSTRFVVESKNKNILQALGQLQGFVPDFGSQDIFSFGLGVDVGNVSSSINAIWADLLVPVYECAPLKQLQERVSSKRPSAANIVTSLANGVKGLSFSVIDAQVSTDGDQSQIESLDSWFAISAQNPVALFNNGAMFVPELMGVELVDGGEAVDVGSTLLPTMLDGINAKLAIRGNHLVLFTGDKGAEMADKLSTQQLESNGIVAAGVDVEKTVDRFGEFDSHALEGAFNLSGFNKGLPQKGRFQLRIAPYGIEFVSHNRF